MPVDDGDKIVGHKTFFEHPTGFRHEPLTKREADEIWKACEANRKQREADMPDEKAAIATMFQAWYRLKELDWREAMYCPKDGSSFHVIESGSTGIFPCHYQGKWPDGHWWIEEDGGSPSNPVLFKLYPEDQAREDARRAEAAARFKASAPQQPGGNRPDSKESEET